MKAQFLQANLPS